MKNWDVFFGTTVLGKCLLGLASAAMMLLASEATAKSGKIVNGENGTKWCCVDGKTGDSCVKGASSVPVGVACNFAELTSSGEPAPVDAPAAGQQINKTKSNVKNN
jgi:hypothetical protein